GAVLPPRSLRSPLGHTPWRVCTSLFEPQSLYRVKSRRFAGGVEPKEDADGTREKHRNHDRIDGNQCGQVWIVVRERHRGAIPDADPDGPAEEADHDGFDK